jgi:hypothetical protein
VLFAEGCEFVTPPKDGGGIGHGVAHLTLPGEGR